MKTAEVGHGPSLQRERAQGAPLTRRARRERAWAATQPDGTVVVGVDERFFKNPGEYVFSKLPREGEEVVEGERFTATIYPWGVIQKTFHCPLGGTVVEVNQEMERYGPWDARDEPHGAGWLFRVATSRSRELTGFPAWR